MICFCHFCKKRFCLFWVWPILTPSFDQVGPKNGNFQRFQQKIFRITGLQLKLFILTECINIFHWKPAKKLKKKWVWSLGQIRSNVVKKSKETGIINRFFSYFAQGIHFKARRVVIQTPEWKFKANIARNAIFQG